MLGVQLPPAVQLLHVPALHTLLVPHEVPFITFPVSAHTELPVIGIPVETSSLKGLDSLLSTVQMPAGTPVATVAVGPGGVRNAAFLAARILALSDKKLEKALADYKEESRKKVLGKKVVL